MDKGKLKLRGQLETDRETEIYVKINRAREIERWSTRGTQRQRNRELGNRNKLKNRETDWQKNEEVESQRERETVRQRVRE